MQIGSGTSQGLLYDRRTLSVGDESLQSASSPQATTTQQSSVSASRIQINAIPSAALASALWQTLIRKANGQTDHAL